MCLVSVKPKLSKGERTLHLTRVWFVFGVLFNANAKIDWLQEKELIHILKPFMDCSPPLDLATESSTILNLRCDTIRTGTTG